MVTFNKEMKRIFSLNHFIKSELERHGGLDACTIESITGWALGIDGREVETVINEELSIYTIGTYVIHSDWTIEVGR